MWCFFSPDLAVSLAGCVTEKLAALACDLDDRWQNTIHSSKIIPAYAIAKGSSCSALQVQFVFCFLILINLGDIIGFLIDLEKKQMDFSRNGISFPPVNDVFQSVW